MQRRGWYPRHTNDIHAKQVFGKINKKLELYSPAGICHLCRDKREELHHCSCNGALGYGGYCEECKSDMQVMEKCECKETDVYELLRTGMVDWPAQVFTRYMKKISHA